MEEVLNLMRAGIGCIWIKTQEENETVKDIIEIMSTNFTTMPLYSWSNSSGKKKIAMIQGEKSLPVDIKVRDAGILFENMAIESGLRGQVGSKGVYILKDLQHSLKDPKIRRYIRDMKEGEATSNVIMIVLSQSVEIPSDLMKLFRVVSYDLPTRHEVATYIHAACNRLAAMEKESKKIQITVPSSEVIPKAITACMGMTLQEISMTLSECICKTGTIDVDFLMASKVQEIKKSGILDYKTPSITLEDVGGHNAIKDWLMETKELFSQEARDFGLPTPKGFMAVGIPGCAKTMLAEAFAGMMHIPLLSLSMAKIMNKMVGESEQKIEYALEMAKSCAPCVLLFDEVEKMLGGATISSNVVDGGVTNRVLQSILKFMNDNDNGVYVVMTSNDVSALPPEFTRAGRIDAQWYFGLPHEAERKEIFRIHFNAFHKVLSDAVMNTAVTSSEGYTGAEIKEVVSCCMRKAFVRSKQDNSTPAITSEDIKAAIEEVIPISRSSKEKIMALENYCKDRARKTDYEEEKEETSSMDDIFSKIKLGAV